MGYLSKRISSKRGQRRGQKSCGALPLGDGFSGISIANGRAYTMFAEGEDEVVMCLDAETGAELWRYLDDWFYTERQGGNGPRSTPTVDGNTVYVLSVFGRLVALNADTGKELWDLDFTKAFSSSMPRWGFSTSPVVENATVCWLRSAVQTTTPLSPLIKKPASVFGGWRLRPPATPPQFL